MKFEQLAEEINDILKKYLCSVNESVGKIKELEEELDAADQKIKDLEEQLEEESQAAGEWEDRALSLESKINGLYETYSDLDSLQSFLDSTKMYDFQKLIRNMSPLYSALIIEKIVFLLKIKSPLEVINSLESIS